MDVNDTENTENKVSDESAEFANSASGEYRSIQE